MYSFAVVAFELICGTAPFDGEHPAYVCAEKIARPAPALSNRTPQWIEPRVDAIFDRALSRDASARPASCAAFVASLL